MLFCSQVYLIFFTCVFLLYWMTPWQQARVWLLLAASFYFYASWNKGLACVIAGSTFIDYWLARGMDGCSSHRLRKCLLTISIVGNLGLLCYFKYANFFLASLESALLALGATTSLPLLRVILPIGISFYTFEAINYTVDVYRRKVRAERSLANFMLFITFFPHLVAGPIVRARDFLPQTHRRKRWDWARLNLGAQFFLVGLFKKLAIADRMAAFVDPVFANPGDYPTHTLWMAVLAYTLQIYGDFSGYSDMAIGSAHMLGYKLAQNFNMPFLAANMSELWQRWHISLSSWLRDYLFIPLGGSRGGRWQTCRNLLITMTLGGLWHGASWVYVIWGSLHGLILIGHRLFHGFAEARPRLDALLRSAPGTAFRVGLTFLTFCLTCAFFRAASLWDAGIVFRRLVVPSTGLSSPAQPGGLVLIYVVVACCHALAVGGWARRTSLRWPAPLAGVGYAVVLSAVMVLTPASGRAFIYFQF
jgi:alginate O-acetyltransferase complex protein AlgI